MRAVLCWQHHVLSCISIRKSLRPGQQIHRFVLQDGALGVLMYAVAAHLAAALHCVCYRSIAERLSNSPKFQALFTSRQLPTQPYLYKVAEVPCEFSFNADGRAYLYVKSPAAAPPAILSKFWCKDGLCWLPSTNHLQLGLSIDEPLVAAARDFVMLNAATT